MVSAMPVVPPVVPPKVQAGSWKTVLVVDPDKEQRARVVRLLREAAGDDGKNASRRLAVQEADNGNLAWTLIETAKPDMVVCEILLEGLSGMQLLRRLRERYQKQAPRVLIATHMGNEVDRYWALRNGAAAFVVKPFEDEFFRERSAKLLTGDELDFDSHWPSEI